VGSKGGGSFGRWGPSLSARGWEAPRRSAAPLRSATFLTTEDVRENHSSRMKISSSHRAAEGTRRIFEFRKTTLRGKQKVVRSAFGACPVRAACFGGHVGAVCLTGSLGGWWAVRGGVFVHSFIHGSVVVRRQHGQKEKNCGLGRRMLLPNLLSPPPRRAAMALAALSRRAGHRLCPAVQRARPAPRRGLEQRQQ
jgi:hypothetical protein